MEMSGVMATIATMPKASVRMFPPRAVVTPMLSASRKVAVMGPDATPPESNAIEEKTSSVKKVRSRATNYPPVRKFMMEMPVSARRIAMPTEMPTPAPSAKDSAFFGIAPAVTSSTWCSSTCTAGSAATMK